MLRLAPPVVLSHAQVAALWDDYVKAAPNQTRLLQLSKAVKRRHCAYSAKGGDPIAVGATSWPSKTSDGGLLYSCYKSGRGADAAIVEAARKAAVEHCPYCGIRLRRRPHDMKHELDHHLPRSHFPEFSVLVLNLVLACHDCNSRKLATYASANGGRRFLHPYFDACLGTRLLDAVVEAAPDGTPRVSFRLSGAALALGSPMAAVVDEHVSYLDVLERLADTVLGEFVRLIEFAASSPIAEARHLFERQATAVLRTRPNDPHGVAFLAASVSSVLPELLTAAQRKV